MTTNRTRARAQRTTGQMLTGCRHCGGYFESTADSGVAGVCPECAEELYERCPECGEAVERAHFVTLADGSRMCRNCAREACYLCDECGTWHRRADEPPTSTGNADDEVCPGCAEDFERCERCGTLNRAAEMFGEVDGRHVCCRCAEESGRTGMQRYSYKPTPIFHRAECEPRDALVLGIELEMDEGNRAAAMTRIAAEYGTEWLYFKSDCSVSGGVELVTHPISPRVLLSDEGKAMWRSICSTALDAGMRSHDTDTCGLHIHVNRDFFGAGKTNRLMAELKLQGVVDRHFAPLAIFSRRKEHLLNQWAKRPMLPTCEGGWLQKAQSAHDSAGYDRYRAVNIQNGATIEFRLFRGTLKADTLFATLEFVSGLCEFAKRSTVGQLEETDWYELCERVMECCPCPADELEAYLIDRELMAAPAPAAPRALPQEASWDELAEGAAA